MNLIKKALCFILLVGISYGQYYEDQGEDYRDYADDRNGGQDNLYNDYAGRQAQKQAGGGGPGMMKMLAFCGTSWFLGGKVHSKRAVSKVTKKYKKDQKDFYVQCYTDIMNLQQQNAEMQQYIDQITMEQRDGEFDIADINRDNKVSRAEFNMYKKEYQKKNPEMANQFPRFEDFDPDSDGLISKAEYDAYYRRLTAR